MRLVTKLVVAGAACGLMFTGASPAMAASATAYSTDAGTRGASTHFDDGENIYTVCDRDADGMRAVGWIEVRQADGSWNKFPKIEALGDGNCVSNKAYIIREDAAVMIKACRKNGDGADRLRDCGSDTVSGS